MQQLRCGWLEGKMGVEPEEEGDPAEEEDFPRAMEPSEAGVAGSWRGARRPGDGGKGGEDVKGGSLGQSLGRGLLVPLGPGEYGHSALAPEAWGDCCVLAHTDGVHRSPGQAGLFWPPVGTPDASGAFKSQNWKVLWPIYV